MLRPLALIVILLLAPTAQAGWFDREVAIQLAPERAGDRMSYEIVRSVPVLDARGASQPHEDRERVTVLVEGPATALDAYGIERATVSYRLDVGPEERVERAMRCHRLAEGVATVRTDHLGAPGLTPQSEKAPRAQASVTFAFEPVVEFGGAPCASHIALAAREIREGDVLAFDEVDASRASAGEPRLRSTPATATTFEGRDALQVSFATSYGVATYVLADGLPAYASRVIEVESDEGRLVERATLVGYAPGPDAGILASGSATLPERHPHATFAIPEPLALDDEAYGLTFPFAEALAAIRADPAARADAWFAAHPDAVLVLAAWDRDARGDSPAGVATRGTWTIAFADERAGTSYSVTRIEGASTPLGPLAAPQPIDRVTAHGEFHPEGGIPVTAELASSADLVKVASAHGHDVDALATMTYAAQAAGAQLMLSFAADGGDAQLSLDPARGAALAAYTFVQEQTGLLGPFTGGVHAEPRGVFAAIDAPTTLATGAAAATGLGLLLLFVLVPLFTRLRRDRLLDNPVRARIYDRIRAEPGIHRAELVDFTGIGEGATRHHLQQLVKHHLILETVNDGFVRYFAAGEVPPSVARREAILRAGSHRAVYELFAREPTITLREAGARLGLSAPSVHRAKRKLEQAGLLPAAPDASSAVAEA